MNKFFNNLGLTAGFCMVAIVIAVMLAPPQVLSQAVGTSNAAFAIISAASSKNDPCQAAWASKSSAPFNVAAASTVALATSTGTAKVYACAFKATVSGTTPTIIFKTGTQTTTPCDTSTATVSGTYAITSGALVDLLPVAINSIQSPAAGQVCITVGGTTPSVQGMFSFVTQ